MLLWPEIISFSEKLVLNFAEIRNRLVVIQNALAAPKLNTVVEGCYI